mmetsp:Transcript_15514/g.36863  ORF Transcript_15514/g.36863 Transcript_15514/m.36863 type:complete len:211 (+) Transcript_15514:1281-1913(+)
MAVDPRAARADPVDGGQPLLQLPLPLQPPRPDDRPRAPRHGLLLVAVHILLRRGPELHQPGDRVPPEQLPLHAHHRLAPSAWKPRHALRGGWSVPRALRGGCGFAGQGEAAGSRSEWRAGARRRAAEPRTLRQQDPARASEAAVWGGPVRLVRDLRRALHHVRFEGPPEGRDVCLHVDTSPAALCRLCRLPVRADTSARPSSGFCNDARL